MSQKKQQRSPRLRRRRLRAEIGGLLAEALEALTERWYDDYDTFLTPEEWELVAYSDWMNPANDEEDYDDYDDSNHDPDYGYFDASQDVADYNAAMEFSVGGRGTWRQEIEIRAERQKDDWLNGRD